MTKLYVLIWHPQIKVIAASCDKDTLKWERNKHMNDNSTLATEYSIQETEVH